MNRKTIGFIFVIIGFILMLISFSSITGFVISQQLGAAPSFTFGLVIFLVGLVILILEEREEEGGLAHIIRTKGFEKATRKQDPKVIERAIRKIGTGLAGEEFLKISRVWSIRTDKKGRIIYRREGDNVSLIDYTPDHEYKLRYPG